MIIHFEKTQDAYKMTQRDRKEEKKLPENGIGNMENGVMTWHTEKQATVQGTYEKDIAAFDQLKSIANNTDTKVQKMYMTVLANNTSSDEFSKMMENGYNVEDLDVESVVTILDQIKAVLVQSGENVSGFTDDIDQKTLEQIVGNAGYAEALKQPLSDESIKYMVENDLQPSAENIHKAMYSTRKSEVTASQQSRTWEPEFLAQIDKAIEQAGFEVTETDREDAYYLIENEIPLTGNKIELYQKLKHFQQNKNPRQIKEAIAKGVESGFPPEKADVTTSETIYQQAVRMMTQVESLTEHAVENNDTVVPHRVLSLRYVMKNPDELSSVTARRQLEEVRLHMTVEANLRLLRSGYQIDIAPLEDLIEKLKQTEQELSQSAITEAAHVNERVASLAKLPVDILGSVITREIPFTVEGLYHHGKERQEIYAKQLESYEPLQTVPRSDLGDSIKKAFESVDNILSSMGKDLTEENRRAVRILGYHNLEISEKNIRQALETDAHVQSLFREMKPGKVLQMIRDGKDPLKMEIPELCRYLEQENNDFVNQTEDYARFLYHLEQSKEITDLEKERYIGIYRLMRQIDKSDGSATGYILSSGAQLTLGNLLTAIRSEKRQGIDYKIDETFGGRESRWYSKSIAEQIEGIMDREQEYEFLQQYKLPTSLSNMTAAAQLIAGETDIYKKYLGNHSSGKETEEQLIEGLTDKENAQHSFEEFASKVREILQEGLASNAEVNSIDVKQMQGLWKQIQMCSTMAKQEDYRIPLQIGEEYALVHVQIKHGETTPEAEVTLKTDQFGELKAIFTVREDRTFTAELYSENQSEKARTLLQEIGNRLTQIIDTMDRITIHPGVKVHPSFRYKQMGRNSVEKGEKIEVSTGELYQMAKVFLQGVRNNY